MTPEEKEYNERVLKHMHRDSIFNCIMAVAALGSFVVITIRYLNTKQ